MEFISLSNSTPRARFVSLFPVISGSRTCVYSGLSWLRTYCQNRQEPLWVSERPTILVCLGLRGFLRCGMFSAKIRKVPGRPGWVGYPATGKTLTSFPNKKGREKPGHWSWLQRESPSRQNQCELETSVYFSLTLNLNKKRKRCNSLPLSTCPQ